MSKRNFLRSITAASLTAAVFVTSSMMTFALPGKATLGELIVTNGAQVTVNGEAAQTGRTVFSSNTITTPANAGATVNLGELGQVELAPNSSINLSFSENAINGTLLSGRVKVSGANEVAANIQTSTAAVVAEPNQAKVFTVSLANGKTNVTSETGVVKMNEAGKTVAVGQTTDADDDNDGFFNSSNGIIFAVIVGAAAAGLIYIAVDGSNEVNLAGGGVVVSPTR